MAAPPAPPPEPVLPPDSEIQRIVDDRVVTYRDTVALVVGVVEPAGRRLFVRGPAQAGNDETVDGDTIFEIGSVTKVFTALLLADMVRRNEVSLNDPVAKYLPAEVKLPQRGRAMTLLDLATHTSGLPRVVSNVAVTDFNNPNAGLTQAQFLQSVESYELTRDVGSAYDYSNAGYELLGIALAAAGGADYETLLKSRILDPLHLKDTRLSPSAEEKDLLASGYDEHLDPLQRAPLPTLYGSEGLRSTANDLLDFLEAEIGIKKTPLAGAMADTLRTRRPTQYLELKAALGWQIALLDGLEIVWHSGQTPGFRAFVGFSPELKAGVVVLSNSNNAIDDIGVHLLDKKAPLRTLRREAPVNPGVFDNYIGQYQVSATFTLSVTRDGNRLYIQGTGQPRAELFAEDNEKFFLRAVNGEVTFQNDASGRARGMSLTQDGKTAFAIRTR
jgi:CubicO group peptidase (beta-lactamase class C family)